MNRRAISLLYFESSALADLGITTTPILDPLRLLGHSLKSAMMKTVLVLDVQV